MPRGIIISMDGESHRWGHPIHRIIDWTQDRHIEQVMLATEALINELKRTARGVSNIEY